MKYYSEKLNELFDTPEALELAEGKKSSKTKKKTAPEVTEEATTSEEAVPTKKQLAAAVETADIAVKEAYANYESAKLKVEELSKKYLAEVDAILEPAKQAVKDAEQQRYEAIRTFNESFGAYQVTYNGARAADELMKAITNMKSNGNSIWRDLFWF